MNLRDLLIFATGVAVGSLVTWKFVDKKYHGLVCLDDGDNYEWEECNDDEEDEEEVDVDEKNKNKYNDILDSSGYINYSTKKEEEEKNLKKSSNGIYVITPEEFDDFSEDHEVVTLTYYADKVLADQMDNVINDEDIEDTIGKESLDHFGEFEEDSVYVWNDKRKTVYEILADVDKFSDVYPE